MCISSPCAPVFNHVICYGDFWFIILIQFRRLFCNVPDRRIVTLNGCISTVLRVTGFSEFFLIRLIMVYESLFCFLKYKKSPDYEIL